ncbi:hypothetical protein [Parasphingorhabdus sp.]|uniref:hypothetical protein n=1 Tax=Parasphingorhabdus sp. TaxID=2709688 RepID=UPI0030023442
MIWNIGDTALISLTFQLVIPAQAGIQSKKTSRSGFIYSLDSRLRGNDKGETPCQFTKLTKALATPPTIKHRTPASVHLESGEYEQLVISRSGGLLQ